MKTDIFQAQIPQTSEYERGRAKVHQSPAESRDMNLPGQRMNPELAVVNLTKPKPATGRRP